MQVTHLKFRYYDPHPLDLASSDGIKTHEFQLGLGPCGRWVTAMEVHVDLATVRVVQVSFSEDTSDDTAETKVFMYRLEDIRGRIAALCK